MAKPPDTIATEEHHGPSRPSGELGRPVLVLAFPKPAVLPLPSFGAPVGREWLAEQGVSDAKVSTGHLLFARAGGKLTVADAGSRNGTWLDGRKLAPGTPAPLADGALLRVGQTLLVFRERFVGALAPAPPIGKLVAPFGLRALSSALSAWKRDPSSTNAILIEGETGTGKELAARAFADALRPGKPYGVVNIAAVPAGVFESQLFGHVANAFSGAGPASRGAVGEHDGGTVFLDEIGELPLDQQPKLLRLLDNAEAQPVGAPKPTRVDVLVVAATNRDLDELVDAGRFRADLLARFHARAALPPLRERAEDIFPIALALAKARLASGSVEVEAVERLLLDPWETNVRGLHSALRRIGEIDPQPGLRAWSVTQALGELPSADAPLTAERVKAALAEAGGKKAVAARLLGVDRGKLLRFLKQSDT